MDAKRTDAPASETTPDRTYGEDIRAAQQPQSSNDRAALVDLVKLIGDSVNVAGEHLISQLQGLGFPNDDGTVAASNDFLSSIMPAIIFRSNILYDYIHKCIFTLTRQRQQTQEALLAQQQVQEDQIAHEVRALASAKNTIGVLNELRIQSDAQLTRLKQLCNALPSNVRQSVEEMMKIVQEVEADVEKNMSLLSSLNITIPQKDDIQPAPGAPGTTKPGSVATSGTLASSSKDTLTQTALDATQIFAEMRHPDDPEDRTSKLCTRLIG